jgi:malonate transporter and related proteins
MSAIADYKLVAMLVTVGVGGLAGRFRLLGDGCPARVLGRAAQYVFVPAVLFLFTAPLWLFVLSLMARDAFIP